MSDSPFEIEDQRQPWFRMADESRKAFVAFRCYAELGDQRSLSEVARRLGKSKQLLSRWSARHKWIERVKAFDDRTDEMLHESNLRERKRMVQRHARAAIVAQNIALCRLADAQEAIARGLQDSRLDTMQAGRLLDIACKLERLARGGDLPDDAVAKIVVHVGVRERPRYEDEAERMREQERLEKWRN